MCVGGYGGRRAWFFSFGDMSARCTAELDILKGCLLFLLLFAFFSLLYNLFPLLCPFSFSAGDCDSCWRRRMGGPGGYYFY